MKTRGTIYGNRRGGSPMSFVADFAQSVDRAVFCFTLTPEQRAVWAKTPGAHPTRAPGIPALIAAGLR